MSLMDFLYDQLKFGEFHLRGKTIQNVGGYCVKPQYE